MANISFNDFSFLWVVWFRRRHERLQREQHRSERHCCRPLVLEDVEADGASHRGDVRVPDLGDEADFGRVERIRVGNLKLQAKNEGVKKFIK